MTIELLIEHDGKIYIPVVEDGIKWTTERKESPSSLTFNVVKDGVINFTEGDKVRLCVDGIGLFCGYVFTKKRTKENTISVTAYDQLRYFKNKHSYEYYNMTATQIIKDIIDMYGFYCGELEDTAYIIPSLEVNMETLFDAVQTTLDLTISNRGEMYVFYDDYGSLNLKNISSMIVPIVIDEETGENFSYTSSIDSDTYNQVVVYNEDGVSVEDKYKSVQDDDNIAQWGLLRLFETFSDEENGQIKAEALLSLYNKKTRNLSVSNAVGDKRVRGGCMVVVQLNLGDVITNNLMLVESCSHTFKESEHFMNLTLRGGEFVG